MSAASQAVPAPPVASRRQAWRSLWKLAPYLARYKGGMAGGILALLLMGIAGALPPLYIGAIIDSLSGHREPMAQLGRFGETLMHWLVPFYAASGHRTLALCCLLLVAVIAIKGVFLFASRWVLIGISRDIEFDLRADLLSRLLRLDPEFYVRNRTGELMSRATNDLSSVRMVVGPGLMYSATTLVTMILAIFLMVRLSPTLTLWVLLPVPVVAVAVRYFGRRIHGFYERIQAMLAVLSARVQENLTGVRVLRAYCQEAAETAAFDEPNRLYVKRNIELISTWALFMPSLQVLIGTTFLLVLWQGGRLVMFDRISLGTLIAFYAYMAQLVWPMIALGWVTNIFQRGAASMGRLDYILGAQPRILDRAPGGAPAGLQGEIEFRHLSFRYPTTHNGGGQQEREQAPVLGDINLRIAAGSVTAIVGATGSGKSTLAALVARLWEAPPGTLLIDRRPIEDWPLDELRRSIGFVPQETFLFSDTLRENISLGVPGAPLEAVAEAAEVAGLAGDVADFPQKYDTIVGERGITLSGGQKQRTALARAVARDPKILILDDAFASVDSDTEERILARLERVMRRRTTLIISHRVSTVRRADRIVVLDRGRIVEEGTHDELIASGGHYAELYRRQLLEEELERV
ncbi:MAG TPA: ABC transporter ATP-binding protein [Patescibacteria group bacterium]|nr:ABC transporter ATP-binding protein [Patescibacteria group bacterium]